MRARGIVVAGLMAAAGARVMTGTVAAEAEPAPARVHTDARAMERAVLETVEALMRDDLEAVGPAVKKIEAGCRELRAEDDRLLGRGFKNLDQALHLVMRGTRGYASAGNADEAFTEFVWVLRSCRQCHTQARRQGQLPAEGPLWEGGANPRTKPVETTQSTEEGR